MKQQAVVIGGGLAGSAAAYSLASRGGQVTLIERASSLGDGASGNKAGIVSPLISHKTDTIGGFYLAGFEKSVAHIRNLQNLSCDISFNQCGVVDLKTRKSSHDTAVKLKHIAPACASKLTGVSINENAVYVADSGYTSPQKLCAANIAACGNNVKVIYHMEAISLNKNNDIWRVLDKNGNEIAEAPIVVVANAYDAKNFQQLDWMPVSVLSGQVSYLTGEDLGIKTVINYDGGYIMPYIDGVHYLGATFRRGSADITVTQEDHIKNIENLKNHINIDVSKYSLSGRASVRTTLPDRRPAIGKVPDAEGLYISVGHGSRGLTSTIIAGEIITSLAFGEEIPLAEKIMQAINPARFLKRKG